MEEVYLYSVAPKRPIMLPDGTCIRTPKSVYLSKEDLKSIITKAVIYRRFPEGNVKVTTENIDEVHVENNTAEAKAKAKQAKVEELSKHVGTVTVAETPATPVKAEEPKKVEEPVKEEVKEDVEEVAAEEVKVAEEVSEEVKDDTVVDPVEEIAETNEEVIKGADEETPATEVVKEDESKDNRVINYNNNNKKRNRNN